MLKLVKFVSLLTILYQVTSMPTEPPAIVMHDDLQDVIEALTANNITLTTTFDELKSNTSSPSTTTFDELKLTTSSLSTTPFSSSSPDSFFLKNETKKSDDKEKSDIDFVNPSEEDYGDNNSRNHSESVDINEPTAAISTTTESSQSTTSVEPTAATSTTSAKPEIENREVESDIGFSFSPLIDNSWNPFEEPKSTTSSPSTTPFSTFNSDSFFSKNETKKSDDEERSDIDFVNPSEDYGDDNSSSKHSESVNEPTAAIPTTTESSQSTTSVEPTPMAAAIVPHGGSSHLTSSLYSLAFVLIIFCAI